MWLSFMIHICKMIRYPSIFHFLKILIFWVVRGVTGQKIVQNDKKFWVSCSISLEPYVMWLSFMLHVCKMIKSPGVFVNFSKFWFYGSSGGRGWGWKGKKGLKWQKKLCLLCLIFLYFRNHTSFLWSLLERWNSKNGSKWQNILSWTPHLVIVKNDISSNVFHFVKFLMSCVFRGVKR